MHHNVNLYSNDLIIYRPIQKDKCVKCEVYKNLTTKTEKDEINQKDHVAVADYMQSRMSRNEKTCASRQCLERKVGPRKPRQTPEDYEKLLLKQISEPSSDNKDKTESTGSKTQSNSNERPQSEPSTDNKDKTESTGSKTPSNSNERPQVRDSN